MNQSSKRQRTQPKIRNKNLHFLVGLARAFAGAILFSLPLLMTMEMWWLGFHIDRLRLVMLLLANLPLLIGLSHFSGFEETFDLLDDVLDAFVAYAVGFITPVIILPMLGIITPDMPMSEIIGKIAIQAVPGSIGALLAQSELGGHQQGENHEQKQKQRSGYWGELFLMIAGALFLSLQLAPTEETPLLAFQMGEWRAIALMLFSILLMHAFVYGVQFTNQAVPKEGTSFISLFLRFTIPGYALVLLVCLFVLWVLGHIEGVAIAQIVQMCIAMAFPGAAGAAVARLII